MNKREISLTRARVAGYHEDRSYFTRLCIESPVALNKLAAAFQDGRTARTKGVRCDCFACKKFVSEDTNLLGHQARPDIAVQGDSNEIRKKPA